MTSPTSPSQDWLNWHDWLECPFDAQGNLEPNALQNVIQNIPKEAGVYVIATRTSDNRYQTQYIGRSGRDIRDRVNSHLKGKGNKIVKDLLQHKQDNPYSPMSSLYVTFVSSQDQKLIEKLYLDAEDRPIANLRRERLPKELRSLSSPADRKPEEYLRLQQLKQDRSRVNQSAEKLKRTTPPQQRNRITPDR